MSGFKVVTIASGEVTKREKDERSYVQKMFCAWDGSKEEGERMSNLPLTSIDCSKGSPADLGYRGPDSFKECILLLENYKGDVEKFRGQSKGKDQVILGGCQGFNSPNLMVPREQLAQLAGYIIQVHTALNGSAGIREVLESILEDLPPAPSDDDTEVDGLVGDDDDG